MRSTKGSSSPRGGCFKCGVAHFQRDCNARKSTGKQSSGKGKQSKPWSKSEGKGKSGENKGNPKEKSKGTKVRSMVPKARTRVKHRNDGWNCDGWNDGWSPDEWNDDWSSVGWREGWEQTYDNPASSFALGVLDLGATSSPKWLQWLKMNLDTGAAVSTFPLNFGPDGAGDGRFHRTASGEWIPDAERNKNMKIQDMLFTGVGVLLVSKVEVLVGNIEVNCWRKKKEKEQLRL